MSAESSRWLRKEGLTSLRLLNESQIGEFRGRHTN
jgi:hypothetical protein